MRYKTLEEQTKDCYHFEWKDFTKYSELNKEDKTFVKIVLSQIALLIMVTILWFTFPFN